MLFFDYCRPTHSDNGGLKITYEKINRYLFRKISQLKKREELNGFSHPIVIKSIEFLYMIFWIINNYSRMIYEI